MTDASGLNTFYEGWGRYQNALLEALKPLRDEQVLIKPAQHQMAVWQLASHIAGVRAFWFGVAGDPAAAQLGEMFKVEETTVPDLPLEFAGWEDNENRPRTVRELVDALDKTWRTMDAALRRWTPDDLHEQLSRQRMNGETQTFRRGWVIYHVMEHDIHHGGEISNILGSHGLQAPDV